MAAGPYGWPQGPPPSHTAARVKLAATIGAVLLLLFGVRAGIQYLASRPHRGPLPGYEERVEVVRSEYRSFYGRLMSNPAAEHLFEAAAREVAARRYPAAIDLLRDAAKEAALPVIFNNLAVLYSETEDRKQAAAAFQEALARDPDDALIRQNLERLGGFNLEMTRPVTAEVEPNNSSVNANLIPLGKDVTAEMAGDGGDTDYFRFIAPPAPRDHVSIEIENRSPTLEIGIRLYDGEERLAMERKPDAPGKGLVEYIAPRPNTTWYLELWSAHGTSGEYTLRVSAMRAADANEPNDDIFSATPISVGSTVEANIMDVDDTDFYSFEAPASGSVTIELENRSATLIPALTMFAPDKRNIGFGPDIRTAGQGFRHTMTVEPHQTYYLQIWSQARTSGAYDLTVR